MWYDNNETYWFNCKNEFVYGEKFILYIHNRKISLLKWIVYFLVFFSLINSWMENICIIIVVSEPHTRSQKLCFDKKETNIKKNEIFFSISLSLKNDMNFTIELYIILHFFFDKYMKWQSYCKLTHTSGKIGVQILIMTFNLLSVELWYIDFSIYWLQMFILLYRFSIFSFQ
jgi:hypothetical protein